MGPQCWEHKYSCFPVPAVLERPLSEEQRTADVAAVRSCPDFAVILDFFQVGSAVCPCLVWASVMDDKFEQVPTARAVPPFPGRMLTHFNCSRLPGGRRQMPATAQ